MNNPDGALLPGMTANATIDIANAPNALVVPLSAVHARQATASASPWGASASASSSVAAGANGSLAVQRNGKLQRVQVHVALVTSTQAAVTPINGSTLSEGENVVTAVRRAQGDTRGQSGGNPMSGNRGARFATHGMP